MTKPSFKKAAFTCLLLSTFLSPLSSHAHSGRTDASGCHHDRQNGGYHCHNSGTQDSPSLPDSSSSSAPSNLLNSLGNVIQLSPSLPSSPSPAGLLLPAQVVSVDNGDTINVISSGKSVIVRFACVDSPEKAQNLWEATSANRLKTLLPKG